MRRRTQKTARLSPEPTKQARAAAAALERLAAQDERSLLTQDLRKSASHDATIALGLQVRDELVYSHSSDGRVMFNPGKTASRNSEEGVPSEKVAKVVATLDRQNRLIGELRSAHLNSVKIAAALAGAVKLAQDGAIDNEDIFDVAREALLNGSVKLSALESVFEESPGEVVDDGKTAGGTAHPAPAIPGFAGPSSAREQDVLTATLRALR